MNCRKKYELIRARSEQIPDNQTSRPSVPGWQGQKSVKNGFSFPTMLDNQPRDCYHGALIYEVYPFPLNSFFLERYP